MAKYQKHTELNNLLAGLLAGLLATPIDNM